MILLLSAICIAYLAAGFAGAAPVPLTDPTGPSEPSYVAHTGRRGTVDILLSSVITLTLCVYTSIHLNIAPQTKIFGFRRVWVYKFYWVLIAMFAPEFVLYAAYVQWRNARELCRLLKTLGGHPEWHKTVLQEIRSMFSTATDWIVSTLRRTSTTPPEATPTASTPPKATPTDTTPAGATPSAVQPDERWCKISLVSAFYIVMGGFAYDVKDLSSHPKYITLTPKGFMLFAYAGLITPDILKDNDIKDRSKADSLGKLLVCVQALWMVINCIARKASGRPTTLIELNVIVHVVVAVVVYGLWWYKPLAVANATLLPRGPRQAVSSTEQSVATTTDNSEGPETGPLRYLLRHHIHAISSARLIETSVDIIQYIYSLTLSANHNTKLFGMVCEPDILDTSSFEIRSNDSDDLKNR
ncbi:hypothetical protein K440DRAFT_595092, partial [Wilcoxina mikolae CBS 423.85]